MEILALPAKLTQTHLLARHKIIQIPIKPNPPAFLRYHEKIIKLTNQQLWDIILAMQERRRVREFVGRPPMPNRDQVVQELGARVGAGVSSAFDRRLLDTLTANTDLALAAA